MSNKIISCFNDITHIFYINLEHRTDRKAHVEQEMEILGMNAVRFNAIQMTNGAIGCTMSHLHILKYALDNKLDHVLIMEDDITFLHPTIFKKQFNTFIENHTNNWDVILFAGNNIPPYEKIDNTCIKITRCQTTTGYLVNGHYINTLMQNIKVGLTQLIKNPTQHSLYAIDIYWAILQSTGNWYLIIPLTVIQKDGYSDIEHKHINYSKTMLDINKYSIMNQIKQNQIKHTKST